MASPQKENGYVPIANELVEQLARLRINGEAMQVLWVIIRKTYGYQKKEDAIALSQFCLATGLNKPAVCRALNKLKALNMIIQKDNAIAKSYRLNKDFDTWKPLSKKITVIEKDNDVIEKDKKRYRKRVLQKKENNYTKDTTRASQSDAGIIARVIASFEGVNPNYARWYANPPQRSAVDRLLVLHGLDTLARVISLLPKTNAKAYFPTVTTPVQLENEWARLESKLKQEKDKNINNGRGLA